MAKRAAAMLVSGLLALAGCSAGIALTQYAERTEHHSIETGSTRKDVEGKLGKPIAMEIYDDGSTIATYQEKVYNYSRFWSDPPWFRALYYAFADLATFGLAELAITPFEAGGKIYRAATKTIYRITVVYDADDRVVDFSRQAQVESSDEVLNQEERECLRMRGPKCEDQQ